MRRAEPLGGLDQGDRVVALGALGQGPGGEDRRPAVGVGGSSTAPLRRTSGRRHERPAGQVGDEDRQAVAEPARARRPGTRTARGAPGVGRSATTETVASCGDLLVGAPRRRLASRRRTTARRRPGAPRAGRSGRRGCPAGTPPRATSRICSGGDRQVARQHPVDQVRVVEQRRVHREPVGPLLDPLAARRAPRSRSGPSRGPARRR